MAQSTDTNDTYERIIALERQARFTKQIACVLAAIMVCLGLLGAGRSRPAVVETQKLVLSDSTGKSRCILEVDGKGNVVQSFKDLKGVERIRMVVDAEGTARFRLFDEIGNARIGAYTLPESLKDAPSQAGLSIVGYGNEKGDASNGGIFLRTTKNGIAGESIFDRDGNERIVMNSVFDGTAGLNFYDSKNVMRLSTSTFPNGMATQAICDEKGTLRLSSSTFPNGSANNWIHDRNGKLRMDSGTYPDGYTVHSLNDSSGAERVLLATFPNGESGYSVMNTAGVTKSSTTVKKDGSVTHYVEKSATERAWEVGSVLLNLHQLYELAK